MNLASIPFIPAIRFTPSDRRAPRLIVLHSTEGSDKAGAARNVAGWFQDERCGSSAHFIVDPAEVVQCVRLSDVAWAAPGANSDGIHIEHCGRASQKEWNPDTITRSVNLAAALCRAYNIPPVFVPHHRLDAPARGITTHLEVTLWKKKIGGHTDPGPGFPHFWFAKRVAAVIGSES